jgi:hypothetical protein
MKSVEREANEGPENRSLWEITQCESSAPKEKRREENMFESEE